MCGRPYAALILCEGYAFLDEGHQILAAGYAIALRRSRWIRAARSSAAFCTQRFPKFYRNTLRSPSCVRVQRGGNAIHPAEERRR